MEEMEYSKFHVEDGDDDDDEEEEDPDDHRDVAPADEDMGCCGVCCFKGCLWGVLGAVYFFIIIPTAIMLILHGYNKSYPLTLCLGALLFLFSMCGIPAACYLVRRKKRRLRKREEQRVKEHSERLTKASYENDLEPCLEELDHLEV